MACSTCNLSRKVQAQLQLQLNRAELSLLSLIKTQHCILNICRIVYNSNLVGWPAHHAIYLEKYRKTSQEADFQ